MRIEEWDEAKSEQPIAVAMVQAAEKQNISSLPIIAFESVTGLWIKAEVAGQAVYIGADRYIMRIHGMLRRLCYAEETVELNLVN